MYYALSFLHTIDAAIAATGTTQGTAYPLVMQANRIATADSNNTGVLLPPWSPYYSVHVYNDTSATVLVWPSGTDTVRNGAFYSLTSGQCAWFRCYSAGNWSVETASAIGKNYLVNPSFDVWQESTSYTPVAATNTYVADRWRAYRSQASYTISRVAGFNGAQYALQIQRAAATANVALIRIGQNILAPIAASLGGKTVIISADVSVGANYSPTAGLQAIISAGTGVDEAIDLSAPGFPTGGVNTAGGTQTMTPGTTSRITWNPIAVPSGITEAAVIFNSNSFVGTAGAADYLQITNVKLEIGIASTPFEHPTLAEIMPHCLRTYQKSFAQGTAPAQNLGAGTGEFIFPANAAAAAAERSGSVRFAQVMRAAPTVSFFNPAAANGHVRDLTAAVDCSAEVASNVTDAGFRIGCTGNGSTAVWDDLGVHWVADCRL